MNDLFQWNDSRNFLTNRIFLTEMDHEVIRSVLEEHGDTPGAKFLRSELDRAEILPEDSLPPDVVSLHSRTHILDELSEREGELIVVPPELAHPESGYVSILSPVGASVIGLSEGQAMDWGSRSGLRRRYRVVQVKFQPEEENRICVSS